MCVFGIGGGVVLPGNGIIREGGFKNDASPTKTYYDVLKMFFNIENDYYR